ncbi:MAG: 2Fe-2S iron-sulfur cluster-binding protein [Oscillospiraceae bacterium]
MLIHIKRQLDRQSAPYMQSFRYEGAKEITVAALLTYLNLNDDLVDVDNTRCRPIEWECSCLQKVCGSCAMIINGTPALACSTFLTDLSGDEVTLEPLTVFPVVQDLRVDRSIIFQHLKDLDLWLTEPEVASPREQKYQYNSAKCLKCGLCLEVCPNYNGAETAFYGPAMVNEAYLTFAQSKDKSSKKNIHRKFVKHFTLDCSKSLACGSVCPLAMKPLSSIGLMNRH